MKTKNKVGGFFVIGIIVLISLVFLFSGQPIQFNSGITGKILLGPLCPVEHVNETQQCYVPYQATVIAIPQNSFGYVRFSSDVNGTFIVFLNPGTYLLKPQLNPVGSNYFYPHAPEQTVTVEPDKFTNVLIIYDTGIR